MRVLLPLLLLLLPQDEKLRKDLEAMTVADVRKLFYFEWGKTGIADFKRQLESKDGTPRAKIPEGQREVVAEAVKEADAIFGEAASAGAAVEKLIRSKNPWLFKLGMKVAGKGCFEEVLPALKEVDEAEAKRVAAIMATKGKARTDDRPVIEQRDDALRRAKAALKQASDGNMQGMVTLGALATPFFDEDAEAWTAWMKENEKFLGYEPAIGLLYVDVHAKAAGVAWSEWIGMTDAQRTAKIGGAKVGESGKRKTIVLECFKGKPWLGSSDIDNTGTDIDANSPALPSWLYLQSKTISSLAPGWDVDVVISASDQDSERAKAVLKRCAAFGFKARIVEFKERD